VNDYLQKLSEERDPYVLFGEVVKLYEKLQRLESLISPKEETKTKKFECSSDSLLSDEMKAICDQSKTCAECRASMGKRDD
jgi:hypothetical protein